MDAFGDLDAPARIRYAVETSTDAEFTSVGVSDAGSSRSNYDGRAVWGDEIFEDFARRPSNLAPGTQEVKIANGNTTDVMASQDDELGLASEHAELPEATEGTNCNSNKEPGKGICLVWQKHKLRSTSCVLPKC